MSFWTLNGVIVVDGTGKPIDCATCPCDGACPTSCTGCDESYAFSVAGLTGDCCSMGNGDFQADRDEVNNCLWAGSATDGWSYVATWEVECIDGAWTVTYILDSRVYPCGVGIDIWVGTIPAADCPDGTYTLTHTSGSDCSGDITVTISAMSTSTTT